jgi:hypothetical protein
MRAKTPTPSGSWSLLSHATTKPPVVEATEAFACVLRTAEKSRPAVPHDDEAVVERGDRGRELIAGRELVDLKLGARLRAVGFEELREDAEAEAVLAARAPCDDEASVGEVAHGRQELHAGGERVDDERLGRQRRSRCLSLHRKRCRAGVRGERRTIRRNERSERERGARRCARLAQRHTTFEPFGTQASSALMPQ